MTNVVQLEPRGIGASLFAVMLAEYRHRKLSKKDPFGAKACWRKMVLPILSAYQKNEPAGLVEPWPTTEQGRTEAIRAVLQNCRLCGRCLKAGKFQGGGQ